MTRILFYLEAGNPTPWVEALLSVDASLDIRTNPDWGAPDDGPAYAFVWEPEPGLIARYPNIKAVFSLGAGVDHLTRDQSLPGDLPIIRMGDHGLKEGMREFVLMGVLMHQRGMRQILEGQATATWQRFFAPAAAQVPVGLMGYGALGTAVAAALKPLGYPVNSWSRTPKPEEDGVRHYNGSDSLSDFLAASQVVVGLLPSTAETRHLLNGDSLRSMPAGGYVINAGRGGLVDLDGLLARIDDGHLAGAMLDVFDKEPLDKDHPAWANDKVIVTPHIAAITRPLTAAHYVLDNIKILERGETPTLILNRDLGY